MTTREALSQSAVNAARNAYRQYMREADPRYPALHMLHEAAIRRALTEALPFLSPPEPTEPAQEVARRMQQTFDVSGDKWFKIAADLILSQDAAIRAMSLQDGSK